MVKSSTPKSRASKFSVYVALWMVTAVGMALAHSVAVEAGQPLIFEVLPVS